MKAITATIVAPWGTRRELVVSSFFALAGLLQVSEQALQAFQGSEGTQPAIAVRPLTREKTRKATPPLRRPLRTGTQTHSPSLRPGTSGVDVSGVALSPRKGGFSFDASRPLLDEAGLGPR